MFYAIVCDSLMLKILYFNSFFSADMTVCDELRHLQIHLGEEFQKGKIVSDLYELVQYAGNIIPRLCVV